MHAQRMATRNVLIRQLLTEIIGWICGWLLVGYGVGGHLTRGIGKIHAPTNHGGRRRPTAAMAPHPRRQGIQQLANMLRNRSTSLKLEKSILITINLTIMCTTCQRR